MAKIELKFLGGFAATDANGMPADSISKKGECLLCLLAVSNDSRLTREQVAGMIWSDRNEEQARASLRQELSRLRKSLGPDALVADRQVIALNAEAVQSDVGTFRLALSQDRSSDHLEAAANLYKGPLLDARDGHAEGFEDCLRMNRERLANEYSDVISELVKEYATRGDYSAAIKWARKAVEFEPLSEIARRREIETLAASGDRSAAAARLSDLNRMLKEEMGVDEPVTMDFSTPAFPSPNIKIAQAGSSTSGAASASILSNLFGDRPAVAVMPFVCQSPDPDDIFFADGMTEDVINSLAAWRWFPVIGRNTTAHFRDNGGALALGAESGARYVLDGSLRRAGQRIRVTVELVDGQTGEHLWSQRFDRDANDIFGIQDEISTHIARLIEPEISRLEGNRLERQRTSELSVWQLLQKARMTKFQSGLSYGTREDNDAALAMFRQAAEMDPTLSDPVAGIATCHWHSVINNWTKDPIFALSRAIARAEKAHELDSNNYLAVGTMGIVKIFGLRKPSEGAELARIAVGMNPSSTMAHHYLACGLEFAGEFEEALKHCEYILALNPRTETLAVVQCDIATCHLLLGNTQEAIEASRKSLAANPNYARGRQRLVASLVAAGQTDEAKTELARVQTEMPQFSLDYVERTYPFGQTRHLEEFQSYFRQLGVS